ncbi:hypothetical protein B5M09_010696 [Aphanomyces astaci]|uniref:Leucine-rich repeat-containing N-terminal plant-type domain-containing protein n=1 Tax=Aphanomyces astaci TaxID=112090 RepID=A0A425CT64_APHAT|nr:hypothetical protein B5M09_010696 [Aphanomyces astaci]
MGQTVSGPSIPDAESRALRDLFSALRSKSNQLRPTRTSLPNQSNYPPFNDGKDSWTGITVEMGHVVSIELPNSHLIGELPAAIGQLTYLRVLNLSSNDIRVATYNPFGAGALPRNLGQLTQLRTLSLEYNSFSGPLPVSATQLLLLERLNVRSNCFSGTIPNDMGNLTQLKFLSLRAIPSSLGNCLHLTFLNLSSNQLSGTVPQSLTQLTALRHLYVFGNSVDFGQSLPPSIRPILQRQEVEYLKQVQGRHARVPTALLVASGSPSTSTAS